MGHRRSREKAFRAGRDRGARVRPRWPCVKAVVGRADSSWRWELAYGRLGALRAQPIHQFTLVGNLDGGAIWPVHQELLGIGGGLGVAAEGSGLQQGLTVELIDPENECAHGARYSTPRVLRAYVGHRRADRRRVKARSVSCTFSSSRRGGLARPRRGRKTSASTHMQFEGRENSVRERISTPGPPPEARRLFCRIFGRFSKLGRDLGRPGGRI